MLRSGSSLRDQSGTLFGFAKIVWLAMLFCVQGESALATAYSMTAHSTNNNSVTTSPAPFYPALLKALKKRKIKLEEICKLQDETARRVLEEYGAIFLATKDVKAPPACMFYSEDEVGRFQASAGYVSETIGDSVIELQPAAMKAYLKARDAALEAGLDITPRGGPEAARRSFAESEALWNTRVFPALEYWASQGRLTTQEAERLRALSLKDQIAAVLGLEKEGVFFSKDFSKSILYSIAAPGASQHLAMLALDVTEFQDERVRQILAQHGWFQTVLSDLPHFTFLGLKEKDLPKHGLRSIENNGQIFWIPNVDAPPNPTPKLGE